MNNQDKLIHNLLINKGIDKTITLFGGNDKPIYNFLINNNTFIHDLINNLTLEHIKQIFGDDFIVLKTDTNLYQVIQSKDTFFISYTLWKYFKVLKYTEDEIKDELLPILNKIYNSNLSNINLLV